MGLQPVPFNHSGTPPEPQPRGPANRANYLDFSLPVNAQTQANTPSSAGPAKGPTPEGACLKHQCREHIKDDHVTAQAFPQKTPRQVRPRHPKCEFGRFLLDLWSPSGNYGT